MILLKGDYELYYNLRRIILPCGQNVHMSPLAFILVRTALEAMPRSVSYEEVHEEMYGDQTRVYLKGPDRHRLAQIAYKLRRKLDPDVPERYLGSHVDFGYFWNPTP
jgi:DNA-binding response OmpR family regulator